MVGDTLRVPRSEALNGSPKVRSTLQVLRLEALNESPKVGGTLQVPRLEALNGSQLMAMIDDVEKKFRHWKTKLNPKFIVESTNLKN